MKSFALVCIALAICNQAQAFKLHNKKDLGDECGIANNRANRTTGFIIGGEETDPHDYPWIGALHWDGDWMCGSALISEEWMVTAAHCVDGNADFTVYLGSHNILESDEPNRQVVKVAKAIMHPNYNFPDDDIAVMQLSEPVEFNDYIRPICLPNKAEQQEAYFGADVVGIGWGQADNGNGQAGLREVNLKTLTESQQVEYCNQNYPSVICINTSGGTVGVCFGDSGSPLNYQRENGQYITLGAASFVIGGCQNSSPNGYSRITQNLDWISETTGIAIEEP